MPDLQLADLVLDDLLRQKPTSVRPDASEGRAYDEWNRVVSNLTERAVAAIKNAAITKYRQPIEVDLYKPQSGITCHTIDMENLSDEQVDKVESKLRDFIQKLPGMPLEITRSEKMINLKEYETDA